MPTCPNWFPCPFMAISDVSGIEPRAALEDELVLGWFPLPFQGKDVLKSDASLIEMTRLIDSL